jgi:hypothetical protein
MPDKKNVKPEMLKNVDPTIRDLPVASKFSLKWLSDPEKVFSSWDGRCNLCETHPTEGKDRHLAKHLREASKWLKQRKEQLTDPGEPATL